MNLLEFGQRKITNTCYKDINGYKHFNVYNRFIYSGFGMCCAIRAFVVGCSLPRSITNSTECLSETI